MDKPYKEGRWHTFTTYQCLYCPFDTMDEDAAMEHYQERHVRVGAPPEPQPETIAVAAAPEGTEVVVEVAKPPQKKRTRRK